MNDTHLTCQDLLDLLALVGAEEERSQGAVKTAMETLRKKLEALHQAAPVGIAPLQPAPLPLAVDLKTAAQLLSMSPSALRVELENGTIPAFLAAGSRQWRVRIQALHDYMEAQERRSEARPVVPIASALRGENGKYSPRHASLFAQQN